MRFFLIEPEPVPAGDDVGTEYDHSGLYPHPTRLGFEFDGWLGGRLLEGAWTYIVTRSVGERLRTAQLSGFEIKAVSVAMSAEGQEMYPDLVLPEFEWLDVGGTVGADDFGVDSSRLLVAWRSRSAYSGNPGGSMRKTPLVLKNVSQSSPNFLEGLFLQSSTWPTYCGV
jgi:hypothetical protein